MKVGVVVIGRNEGERLRICLTSINRTVYPVVYVDSGSSDGSLELARALGAAVVELDMSRPFCAARARNAGYRRLIGTVPTVCYVQFVDGDCEIADEWLPAAERELAECQTLAVVAGWLRERSPQKSIYNRIADLEWNFAPAGEVATVGGIFLVRRHAFEAVGGFDESVAAGEEPELCQRLLGAGWRLARIDREMGRHDLAMTSFGQWWTRAVRYGYGSADVARRFGLDRFRRSNRRARLWTAWLAIAALALGGAAFAGDGVRLAALGWLALWPAQAGRVAWRTWRRGQPAGVALAYGFFVTLSNWPQALGQWLHRRDRLHGRPARLVEYKAAASGES